MVPFYWAAQHIPSGWLSLIFGLNPVFTGVLATLWLRNNKGVATDTGIEMGGLYWHFVDLVWVFIFAFFYLW